jgi:hypothetical protein
MGKDWPIIGHDNDKKIEIRIMNKVLISPKKQVLKLRTVLEIKEKYSAWLF